MVTKYAFLFPGQGSQFQGMGVDLYEAFSASKKCIDAASDVAGEDILALLRDSSAETLARSDRCQLSITAASLAIVSALKEKGIEPAACAGFSLGEFPALYAASVLSFEDTIAVVKKRGEIMQRVCDSIAERSAGRAPGMAAVIGLPPEKVIETCAGIEGVYAANMNSARQTVVSGTADGLDAAEAAFKEAGARRVVRLAVAGPYHSPLMQEAADEFVNVLEPIAFRDPSIALFSNVSGKRVSSGAEAKELAVKHLVQSVLWTSEEKELAALISADTDNAWRILEPGPGKVLSGLWKETEFGAENPSVPCCSCESIAELVKA